MKRNRGELPRPHLFSNKSLHITTHLKRILWGPLLLFQFLVCIANKQVSVNENNLNDYSASHDAASIQENKENIKTKMNTATLTYPRGTQRNVSTPVIWSLLRPVLCLIWISKRKTKSVNKNCGRYINMVYKSNQKHLVILLTAVTSSRHRAICDQESSGLCQ